MVKSPKLYVRDTGLLLHLLGIQKASEILESPLRDRILEGYMIEKIIYRERARGEERFFYYGGFSGKHIALLLDRTPSGVGIRFRVAELLGPRDWTCLRSALRQGIIKRGVIVYTGSRSLIAAQDILAFPIQRFLDCFELGTDSEALLSFF